MLRTIYINAGDLIASLFRLYSYETTLCLYFDWAAPLPSKTMTQPCDFPEAEIGSLQRLRVAACELLMAENS